MTMQLTRDTTTVSVDAFLEGVVQDFRRRLALLDDDGDRRAIEDTIALLTDHRLCAMDEPALARLISALDSGRSPVGLFVLKPQAMGAELARRWREYSGGTRAQAPT